MLNSDCFAPLLTSIWSASYFKPFSLYSLLAIATSSSGVPATAVYLVAPCLIASIAASLITFGVSKSGSPAEKLKISLPSAFNSLASVEIAIVIDGDSASILFEYITLSFSNLNNYTKI